MTTEAKSEPELADEPAHVRARRERDALVLELHGDWKLQAGLPGFASIEPELRADDVKRIAFDASSLRQWNSGLVSFVVQAVAYGRDHKLEVSTENLPSGVITLLHLATAVPEAKETGKTGERPPLFARLGALGLLFWSGARELAEFLGESALAFAALFRGRAQFRWRDALVIMQRSGPEALGIVALINFLVGVILAFVGAVQLTRFGAAVFIADLVAIGTVREMGCLMTGVIVCGRTGAAFAAELGAMKVNEEISAFKAFGISPTEFLVLPRLLGLVLMMPLLCVFADLIMILGGFLVCVSMLDVTATEYINRTLEAITTRSFLLGIFKAAVFGILVGGFGCLRGMQSQTNAAGVGQATTSAVVSGITAIVAADGIFAVLCDALGI